MPLPLSTITSLRASFSPFSPLSRPCRLFLSLLQTPTTASTSSASHIDIKVKHLARDSKELPEMTVGFRGGKELRLEVGRLGLTVGDVVEDVARVGRGVSREESLKS
jgi:large subunit ribosomal protein L53